MIIFMVFELKTFPVTKKVVFYRFNYVVQYRNISSCTFLVLDWILFVQVCMFNFFKSFTIPPSHPSQDIIACLIGVSGEQTKRKPLLHTLHTFTVRNLRIDYVNLIKLNSLHIKKPTVVVYLAD